MTAGRNHWALVAAYCDLAAPRVAAGDDLVAVARAARDGVREREA